MKKWPSTFYWLELWRIWRERERNEILWNYKTFQWMKSCLIYKKDNNRIRVSELPCIWELLECNTCEFSRHTRKKEEFGFSCAWLYKPIHIFPLVSSLMVSKRSFSYGRPHSSHDRLKSYPCFILRPYLYFFSRILKLCFPVKEAEFFLKAFCSSEVARFSWASLGVLREKPRVTR